jgi:anthranilate phosphoribosyltransferase
MDEITICDNSYLIHCENGKIFETKIINPQNFGFKKVPLEAIKGGNPEYNAKKILALLEGEKSSYLDIVLLNSAFALQLVEKTKTIEEGIELAKSAIISGKAKMILENLKK